MDALSGLLEGPRARGAFLLRTVMSAPWAMRIADEAPLSLVIAACGTTTLCFDDGEQHRLDEGDLVLVRGPDAYIVADVPTSTPTVIIRPGQRCETVDGEPLDQAMSLGVRTWGNANEPSHVLLSGTYETVAETGRRVLDALPRALVVRHGDLDPALTRPSPDSSPTRSCVPMSPNRSCWTGCSTSSLW